ncbi:hypothetical protein [Polaribacter sp. OB-PA-B3]
MSLRKEEDKKRFNSVIKSKNDNKIDVWYSLIDLVELKGISYRSLKYMVKDVFEKYKEQGSIYKKSGRYYIKYTLLDAFELKQPRKTTIYSHCWKSNISYTTKDFYDFEYHQQIVSEIKNETADVNYMETIELDKSNRYHVHMVADYEPKYLEPIINEVLKKYLNSTQNYRLYCKPVQNKACTINYLIKNPQ